MSIRLCVVPLLLLVVAAPLAAAADEPFPTRQINMVAPFPPGGQADLMARPTAAAMEKILKSPVVVVNKTGAAGAVGMSFVANSKPDGYTLLMALSSISIIPEADKLFDRKPAYTMDQFVHSAGIQLKHVPYSGAAPALTAILGGHVDALASAPAVLLPHIKAGKLRSLAGWGAKRVDALPDLPTFKELGYDAEFYIWAGLFAPRGTPEPIMKKLRDTVRAAVQDPEFKSAMAKMETPIAYMDAPEFQKFWDKDAKMLADAIKRIGRIEEK